MAGVYSTRLVIAQSVGFTPTNLHTCVDGKVTYLRTIACVTGRNLLVAWWYLALGSGGPKFAAANHTELTNDFTLDLYNGEWVFQPGEELWFASDGSEWDVCLSGYELTP